MNLNKYKLAWADFEKWLEKEKPFKKLPKVFLFEDLPFEMQLGVYLKYFQPINSLYINLDLTQWEYGNMEKWQQGIQAAFKTREEELTNKQK